MRNSDIRQTICGVLAAVILISLLSGIAFAFSGTEYSDYIIEQMDEVTINREKVGAKDCADETAEPMYNDDELVTAILVFDDNPVLSTSGTVKTESSERSAAGICRPA